MSVENPNTPTLWEAVMHVLNETVASWFTSLPGRIESYDPTTQSCSVQPLIKEVTRGEDGAREVKPLAIVNGVPVVFPGGGGYHLTFPLAKGDTVLLVMSTWSLDRWKAKGGTVDPEDERRQDISDAVAFAQLRDFTNAIPDVPTDGMSIGHNDGPRIKITTSQIQAGGTAKLALDSDLQALKTVFTNWVVAPTDGGGALKTLLASWSPAGTSTLRGS